VCPLLDPKVKPFVLQWDEETPPTVTTTNYRISISKPLMKDPTLPAHEQCPEGTWICKTVTNRRPDHRSEPPRIVQIIPVAG
ncbi:hypothetical protein PUNSTDRAFT_35083, partial [Punctularia strigosozonata HHB-11173 SS5]|uniref:uncharacterized protein n=1 Tax=Punctularia strigosozonata (strain HHB-11173) TaxID=741275 RepID=UPI0004418060